MNVRHMSWHGREAAIVVLLSIAWGAVGLGAGASPRPSGGKAHVPLDEWAAAHGLAPAKGRRSLVRFADWALGWTGLAGGADRWLSLAGPYAQLTLYPESRRAGFNGHLVWLNEELARRNGQWALSPTDAEFVLDPLLNPEAHLHSAGHNVVVLDPGHGGADQGAVSGDGSPEKEFTLDLARRMRVQLSHAGLKVWLTRDNDRKIDLSKRCRKAAEWEADLFVSLHANQAANREAQGAETYVLPATGSPSTSNEKPSQLAREAYPGNRHDAANTVLGYAVQSALLKETGAVDRGLKRARFVVLREAPCPAVLVECGFLSNEEEAARLESEAYREQLAQSLSRGVLEYVRLVRQARVREP